MSAEIRPGGCARPPARPPPRHGGWLGRLCPRLPGGRLSSSAAFPAAGGRPHSSRRPVPAGAAPQAAFYPRGEVFPVGHVMLPA